MTKNEISREFEGVEMAISARSQKNKLRDQWLRTLNAVKEENVRLDTYLRDGYAPEKIAEQEEKIKALEARAEELRAQL